MSDSLQKERKKGRKNDENFDIFTAGPLLLTH
jgi:hypothetical protein